MLWCLGEVTPLWVLRWTRCHERLNESLLAAGWIFSICKLEFCFTLKSAICRLCFKVSVEGICSLRWTVKEKCLCL